MSLSLCIKQVEVEYIVFNSLFNMETNVGLTYDFHGSSLSLHHPCLLIAYKALQKTFCNYLTRHTRTSRSEDWSHVFKVVRQPLHLQ
jgi:hypothetical protein